MLPLCKGSKAWFDARPVHGELARDDAYDCAEDSWSATVSEHTFDSALGHHQEEEEEDDTETEEAQAEVHAAAGEESEAEAAIKTEAVAEYEEEVQDIDSVERNKGKGKHDRFQESAEHMPQLDAVMAEDVLALAAPDFISRSESSCVLDVDTTKPEIRGFDHGDAVLDAIALKVESASTPTPPDSSPPDACMGSEVCTALPQVLPSLAVPVAPQPGRGRVSAAKSSFQAAGPKCPGCAVRGAPWCLRRPGRRACDGAAPAVVLPAAGKRRASGTGSFEALSTKCQNLTDQLLAAVEVIRQVAATSGRLELDTPAALAAEVAQHLAAAGPQQKAPNVRGASRKTRTRAVRCATRSPRHPVGTR